MNSRIRSPIVGSVALVFFSINWKSIFYVVFSGELAEDRFSFFDANTSVWTLFALPIALGLLLAWAAPWISFYGAKLARVPVDRTKKMEISAEHELILEKTKLESVRRGLLTEKEDSLIDQATRDEKVKSILNPEIRDNLQSQIDAIRTTSDNDTELSTSAKRIQALRDQIANLEELSNHYAKRNEDEAYHDTQQRIAEVYSDIDMYLSEQIRGI